MARSLKAGRSSGRQRQRLVGARQQENAVGLAQALMRPGAVGRIAAIEHHVMRRFEGVEPFRASVRRPATSSTAARDAHLAPAPRQAMGDGHFVQPVLQRHDGEGLGPRLVAAAAIGVLQPAHQHLHQVHHHPRMARDQRLEAVRADAQQFGVAQRHQLGGMWLDARRSATSRPPSRRPGHAPPCGAGPARRRRRRPGCRSPPGTGRRYSRRRAPAACRRAAPNQLASASRLRSAASPTFSSSAKLLAAARAALRDRRSAGRCGRRRETP